MFFRTGSTYIIRKVIHQSLQRLITHKNSQGVVRTLQFACPQSRYSKSMYLTVSSQHGWHYKRGCNFFKLVSEATAVLGKSYRRGSARVSKKQDSRPLPYSLAGTSRGILNVCSFTSINFQHFWVILNEKKHQQ